MNLVGTTLKWMFESTMKWTLESTLIKVENFNTKLEQMLYLVCICLKVESA